MQEQGGSQPSELPEPDDVIQGIARQLGLDAQKKPILFEGLPEEQLFPEEAPTVDGRYIAGACLEQIYNIIRRYTPSARRPRLCLMCQCGHIRLNSRFRGSGIAKLIISA